MSNITSTITTQQSIGASVMNEGGHTLSQLGDVDLANVSNGSILVYKDNEFVARTVAGDVSIDADGVTTVDSIDWSAVNNTPTTIAGYGITDAISNVEDVVDITTNQTIGGVKTFSDGIVTPDKLNANKTVTIPFPSTATQIQALIDAQPKNLNGFGLTFQFQAGHYILNTETSISIVGFYGGGVTVNGATVSGVSFENAVNHRTFITLDKLILFCGLGQYDLNNILFEHKPSTGGGPIIRVDNNNFIKINNCAFYTALTNKSGATITPAAGHRLIDSYMSNGVWIYGSTFGNSFDAVVASRNAQLHLHACTSMNRVTNTSKKTPFYSDSSGTELTTILADNTKNRPQYFTRSEQGGIVICNGENFDGVIAKYAKDSSSIISNTTVDTLLNQSIDGVKTFSASPIVPTPTASTHAATKGYVDTIYEGLQTTAIPLFVTDAAARKSYQTYSDAYITPYIGLKVIQEDVPDVVWVVLDDMDITDENNWQGTPRTDDTGALPLSGVVFTTTNQEISGIKTFNTSPIVPTPTASTQAASKGYVDQLFVDAPNDGRFYTRINGAWGLFESTANNLNNTAIFTEPGLTIPDNWTSSNSAAVVSVGFKSTLTSIGSYAFSNCQNLTSISIPDSVTTIGGNAFSNCQNLTSISIPDSVTTIEDSMFQGCIGLTSISIPDGVTSIGNYAFYGCGDLTSISIPDSVTSIGNSVFAACGDLTSISIPDSVTTIGGSVFAGCTGLTSISIPDSVTSIGNYAFYGCTGLTSISIPDSVTSIGNYAFTNCSSLDYIECLATTAPTIGDDVFTGALTTEIHVPIGATGYGATFGGLTVIYDL